MDVVLVGLGHAHHRASSELTFTHFWFNLRWLVDALTSSYTPSVINSRALVLLPSRPGPLSVAFTSAFQCSRVLVLRFNKRIAVPQSYVNALNLILGDLDTNTNTSPYKRSSHPHLSFLQV